MEGHKGHFSSKLEVLEANSLRTRNNESDYLGCGSNGSVRRCTHPEKGKVVAKCFFVTGTPDIIEKKQKSLQREANVLVRCKHPNIVEIFGICFWKYNIAIILEYVEFGSLKSLIEKFEADEISWGLRLQFATQLGSALSFLHNFKDGQTIYCHGDIKPDNILLDSNLNVKLADFGGCNILKAIDAPSTSIDTAHITQLTLQYVAPEYLSSEGTAREATWMADMYSFSNVLYAIITWHEPYEMRHPNKNVLAIQIISGIIRPDYSILTKVKDLLLCDADKNIFAELKDIMFACSNEVREKRPNSDAVQKKLQTLSNLVDANALDQELETIKRKLNAYNDKSGQRESTITDLTQFSSPYITAEGIPHLEILEESSRQPSSNFVRSIDEPPRGNLPTQSSHPPQPADTVPFHHDPNSTQPGILAFPFGDVTETVRVERPIEQAASSTQGATSANNDQPERRSDVRNTPNVRTAHYTANWDYSPECLEGNQLLICEEGNVNNFWNITVNPKERDPRQKRLGYNCSGTIQKIGLDCFGLVYQQDLRSVAAKAALEAALAGIDGVEFQSHGPHKFLNIPRSSVRFQLIRPGNPNNENVLEENSLTTSADLEVLSGKQSRSIEDFGGILLKTFGDGNVKWIRYNTRGSAGPMIDGDQWNISIVRHLLAKLNNILVVAMRLYVQNF